MVLAADTGFFVYGTSEHLSSLTPGGEPVADVIGVLRVLPAAVPVVTPAVSTAVRFGDEISLLGYDPPPAGPVAVNENCMPGVHAR